MKKIKPIKMFLPYIYKYKFRLILGILSGFISAISLLGLLVQVERLFYQLDGGKPDTSIVQIERSGKKLKFPIHYKKNIVKEKKLQERDIILNINNVPIKKEAKEIEKFTNLLKSFGIKKEIQNQGLVFFIYTFLLFSLFVILKNLFIFTNKIYLKWVSSRAIVDLREDIFKKLINEPMSFYDSKNSSSIISLFQNNVQQVENSLVEAGTTLIRSPLEIVIVGTFFMYKSYTNSYYLTLPIVFVIIPLSLLPTLFIIKKFRKYFKENLKQVSKIIFHMQEVFSNVRTIKAYNTEKKETEIFKEKNKKNFSFLAKLFKYDALTTPLLETIFLIITGIFFVYCYSQGIALGLLLTMIVGAQLIYKPIKQLFNLNSHIQKIIIGLRETFSYLNEGEKQNLSQFKENDLIKGKKEKFEKEIIFKDVSFSYDDRTLLKDINFRINKGDFVAFVGEAGSGKSTIVNLLMNFYPINKGEILLDACKVEDISKEELSKIITLVEQNNTLFNQSIIYNMTYGSQETYDKEHIKEIAEKLCIEQFVSKKNDTYNTNVGEKGNNLSGGQKQRISLARALLKNSDILILDESTSSLDNITERKVLDFIYKFYKKKTIIAIAHRLSTIREADKIFVLEDGKIIESGDHNSLVKNKGLYHKLWDTQFRNIYNK